MEDLLIVASEKRFWCPLPRKTEGSLHAWKISLLWHLKNGFELDVLCLVRLKSHLRLARMEDYLLWHLKTGFDVLCLVRLKSHVRLARLEDFLIMASENRFWCSLPSKTEIPCEACMEDRLIMASQKWFWIRCPLPNKTEVPFEACMHGRFTYCGIWKTVLN